MKVLNAGGGLIQNVDEKTIILTFLCFRAWASLQALQPEPLVFTDLALPESAAEPMTCS